MYKKIRKLLVVIEMESHNAEKNKKCLKFYSANMVSQVEL